MASELRKYTSDKYLALALLLATILEFVPIINVLHPFSWLIVVAVLIALLLR